MEPTLVAYLTALAGSLQPDSLRVMVSKLETVTDWGKAFLAALLETPYYYIAFRGLIKFTQQGDAATFGLLTDIALGSHPRMQELAKISEDKTEDLAKRTEARDAFLMYQRYAIRAIGEVNDATASLPKLAMIYGMVGKSMATATSQALVMIGTPEAADFLHLMYEERAIDSMELSRATSAIQKSQA